MNDRCTFYDKYPMRIWATLQFVLGFILPSIGIVVAYSILAIRVKRRHNQKCSSARNTALINCMTKTVLVVVVAFTLCQTPYHVTQMVYITTTVNITNAKSTVYTNVVAQILVFVSSCCNPIIYGLLNHNFRK